MLIQLTSLKAVHEQALLVAMASIPLLAVAGAFRLVGVKVRLDVEPG
jgi:hypothetical protein